jgi:hypothetical protein
MPEYRLNQRSSSSLMNCEHPLAPIKLIPMHWSIYVCIFLYLDAITLILILWKGAKVGVRAWIIALFWPIAIPYVLYRDRGSFRLAHTIIPNAQSRSMVPTAKKESLGQNIEPTSARHFPQIDTPDETNQENI